MHVLDEEPDDDLDAHESELHARLEMALFESCDNVETGRLIAEAALARDAGDLSKKAFRDLLRVSGQERFWHKFLL